VSLVVADTTPVNYLVLCEAIHVLQPMYGQVVLPSAVFHELNHARTPQRVRAWMNALPGWVVVKTPAHPAPHTNLGGGEREAIALAHELQATELLIDERLAREIAVQSGLTVTGTVGVLEAASARNLLNLSAALEKLRQTNFRFEEGLFQAALARDARRKQKER
jgi:predicted nucleic acid-binding protein